jgi:hypothetical protein
MAKNAVYNEGVPFALRETLLRSDEYIFIKRKSRFPLENKEKAAF